MRGVILAAGDGGRLMPLTLNRPKPLIPVCGRPMIAYTIESLVEAGITDIAIVVGYMGETLRAWVGDGTSYGARISYIFNPDYELGNAVSLYTARHSVADEPFVLTMADHLIHSEILFALLGQDGSSHNTLCVDRLACAPPQISDATRVWVEDDGFISSIGKGIERWNGVDTGVFLLTPQIFEAISALRKRRGDCELSEAVTRLIQGGAGLRACDVSGSFWMDIDTLEDLRCAETILKERMRDGELSLRWLDLEALKQEGVAPLGQTLCLDVRNA